MHPRYTALAIAGALFVAACAEPTVPLPSVTRAGGVAFVEGEQQFVLIATSKLPANLAASVAAAGGQLTNSMEGIGAAVATSSNPGFIAAASKIKGLSAVVADQAIEFTNPRTGEEFDASEMVHSVGAHESFRAAQWNVDAIGAPAAWNAGYQGAGVRVAVLDGGIHSAHIDLTGQIDVGRSVSFTTGAFNTDVGTFWHGTHVAGIIAAKADNIGIVGIAPSATLIGVKVLHGGTGSFLGVIQGIVYAATPIAEAGAGANVINMSLGGYAIKNGSANAHFVNLMNKAVNYARARGVTVVAAAGNDAIDLDHPRSVGFPANAIEVPGELNGVIMVSATGPLGFGLGATDFDRPASYTNFGQSAITLAGPGGDFMLPGNAVCVLPINPSGTLAQVCWALDMVLSTVRGTSNGSYNWAAGTSMASPAVAAVAALVIGKHGGTLAPSQVESILRQSADDLGKPGRDDFYGHGRVNAARAVGAQ